jgi:hypothetical protein
MRWIKHLTAASEDEKIAHLIAEYGHAGYGLWWLVCEAVARQLEGDNPEVTYPLTKWSHLLSLRGSHVMSRLVTLQVTGLVTVERHGYDVTVRIPNLLKYRDEYSRKSGQTPESVRSKRQKQIQNTQTDAEVTSPVDGSTERMYAAHPKKSDFVLIVPALVSALNGTADVPKKLADIEACHAAWCKTDDWKKENGRFAPKLASWIADRGYTKWPADNSAAPVIRPYERKRPAQEKIN